MNEYFGTNIWAGVFPRVDGVMHGRRTARGFMADVFELEGAPLEQIAARYPDAEPRVVAVSVRPAAPERADAMLKHNVMLVFALDTAAAPGLEPVDMAQMTDNMASLYGLAEMVLRGERPSWHARAYYADTLVLAPEGAFKLLVSDFFGEQVGTDMYSDGSTLFVGPGATAAELATQLMNAAYTRLVLPAGSDEMLTIAREMGFDGAENNADVVVLTRNHEPASENTIQVIDIGVRGGERLAWGAPEAVPTLDPALPTRIFGAALVRRDERYALTLFGSREVAEAEQEWVRGVTQTDILTWIKTQPRIAQAALVSAIAKDNRAKFELQPDVAADGGAIFRYGAM